MKSEGKKYYLTKAGLEKFQAEFSDLKKLRIEKAKDAEEYDELDIIDKKIQDISGVLQSYEIIVPPPKEKRDIVSLGATVHVGIGNRVNELTIVGTVEADPLMGKISNESPVGKALIGKKKGDTVVVHAHSDVCYTVKNIKYGE